jgi:molybdate transport system substrate-binding protein
MRGVVFVLVWWLVWYGAAASLSAQGPRASTVTVSAASSLASVLDEVARRYESEYRERVAVNVGGSNTLARQIRAGAKVDVFVSADEVQMDAVAEYLAPGTRVRLLANQLAIAVPTDRARPVGSARDLVAASVRRVAIGDPDAVPVGVYAKAYLQRLGLWAALLPKVVPVGSSRLALSAVEHGAVDAAIVYQTDLAGSRRARAAYRVPLSDGPPIVYPAAVVRGGLNPNGARRFLRFLREPEATARFARAGFVPLGAVAGPLMPTGLSKP